MVEEIALIIAQKRIAIPIQADAVHLLRHRGIVDLDSRDPQEPSLPVDRDVIGNHPFVKVIRDVGRQPDRAAFLLRDGEPDQLRRILRVIERDIGHLMLFESFSLKVRIPEAVHRR